MAVAVLGSAGVSMANVDWAAGAVGNWTNGANWVGGSIPGAADLVEFNGGGAVATIDSDVGTFAKLQTGEKAGTDTINVETGGAIIVNEARLATVAGNTTILNINGGSFTYMDGNTAIGRKGTGIVNVNSGSLLTGAGDDLDLGRDTGSRGELHVNGGTVTIKRHLVVAAYKGSGNSGHVDVSGGTVNITSDLMVGQFGTGTVVLSGGSVTADRARVGGMNTGTGTLTVNAGGLLTVGRLNVGGATGLTGVVNLNGGTVNAIIVDIGEAGTLNLASAGTLAGYTNMAFSADGLLVWEGDQVSAIDSLVIAGTITANGASGDEGKAYDQEWTLGSALLRADYDSGTGNTEVWTVIPEPATLGMVVAMGAGALFIRRRFMI